MKTRESAYAKYQKFLEMLNEYLYEVCDDIIQYKNRYNEKKTHPCDFFDKDLMRAYFGCDENTLEDFWKWIVFGYLEDRMFRKIFEHLLVETMSSR